jgi:hypothetical protein
MSTTYILHGEETSRDSSDNELFFKQFTSLVNKNNVNILLCYWARDKKDWNKLEERDWPKIKRQTNKSVNYSVLQDPITLNEQMKDYDVLYVAAGW